MSHVALLKGINLGKINKVDMKSLKALFEEMGFQNVRTLIQSGNVLFDNLACDEQKIEAKLKETYGFEIPVTIRSKIELEAIQQHPLASKDQVYIMFLKQQISIEQRELLNTIVEDEFTVIDQKTFIIHLTQPYKVTKYTNAFFEKKLQITTTARNLNTVTKILMKM